MDQRDVLLRLIDDVYAAPGTDAGWDVFLRNVCEALHGSGANLVAHNLLNPEAQILLTVGLDPAAGQAYASHWGRFDPWAYSAGTRQLVAGQVASGEQLVPQADLRRTPFYHEFGLPFDVTRCLAAMVEHESGGLSCLTVDRGELGRPFDAADAALVAALLPHLRRSVHLHRRLVAADVKVTASAAALDSASQGVIFLSARGHLNFANRSAEALLRSGDGLSCQDGRLRGTTGADTARLQHSIAQATAVGGTAERARGAVIFLARRAGRRSLVATVSPVPHHASFLSAHAPAVMLLVTDPEVGPCVDERVLVGLFGLTAAEARLACLLASGHDLDQAAAALRVTLGTLRTRLKSVFFKTNTHRQADLVRVLLATATSTGV